LVDKYFGRSLKRTFYVEEVGKILVQTVTLTGVDQSLQRWLSYLSTPTTYEIERIVRALYQSNLGDFETFIWILNHLKLAIRSDVGLKAEEYYSRYPYNPDQMIVNWLNVFSDDDLRRVFTTLRNQMDHPIDGLGSGRYHLYPTYEAILWQCTQKLPYVTL
jgi:hypothetical protein